MKGVVCLPLQLCAKLIRDGKRSSDSLMSHCRLFSSGARNAGAVSKLRRLVLLTGELASRQIRSATNTSNKRARPRSERVSRGRLSMRGGAGDGIYLEDPVSAADESGEPQGKHVVCSELLHHLGLLHHAQLGQHRDSLHVHTGCPHDLHTAVQPQGIESWFLI